MQIKLLLCLLQGKEYDFGIKYTLHSFVEIYKYALFKIQILMNT